MTLKAFIQMHYAVETVYDDDWQDDMQLPFKTCQHAELGALATIRPEPLILPVPLMHENTGTYTHHLPAFYSIIKVTKIFQPPRAVIS